MLKNYIKIGFRNLLKDKFHAVINIFGLSFALAVSLLIIVFVKDELSFDRFHSKAERIYRLAGKEIYEDGREFFYTITPIVVAPVLSENVPEVEMIARIADFNSQIKVGNNIFPERIHVADSSFFKIFDFHLVEGSEDNVFNKNNSLLLSENAAVKFFGKEDVLGKVLQIYIGDTYRDFLVSGVIQNAPPNSSVQYEMIIPFGNSRDIWGDGAHTSLFSVSVESYALVNAGVNMDNVVSKTNTVFNNLLGDDFTGTYEIIFQALTDIHLNKDFPQGLEPVSDPSYAYILSAIAILVLVIASVNFVALSLSKYLERIKEVGIRKVIGAGRNHIIWQFWGEACIVIFFSLLVGLMLAEVLTPWFNELSGRSLKLTFSWEVSLIMFILLFFISFSAGFYPAEFLSRFEPVKILKGSSQSGNVSLFRKGLVVVQFFLSIFLMISAFVMNQQLDYLQNKNLGFKKDQILSIPTGMRGQEASDLYDRFKIAVSEHQSIKSLSNALFTIGEEWMLVDYNTDKNEVKEMFMNIVNADFIPTMEIELIAGRNFSENIGSDAYEAVIVNEALVRSYGWEHPIGKRLSGNFPPHQVIGVVKNFNFASLHTPVAPLILTQHDTIMQGFSNVNIGSGTTTQRKILVNVKGQSVLTTINMLEEVWKTVASGTPFSFSFLDEVLEAQYRQESRLGKIVRFATIFALVIACLGLTSLASLMIRKRRKEIGIRKVLGASVSQVVILITKDFINLVIIAILIASPVAFYVMNNWLQEFTYRIDLQLWPFLIVAISSIVFSWLAISLQSIRAASVNPVKSLKSE